eukprot:403331424
MYKQKIVSLQNEKITQDKDVKFFSYLKRLVEAPQIKEEERFNGIKVLQDFIHDKDSLIYQKKNKNPGLIQAGQDHQSLDIDFRDIMKLSNEDRMRILYQKQAVTMKTYDPMLDGVILEKSYHSQVKKTIKTQNNRNQSDLGFKKFSIASLNLHKGKTLSKSTLKYNSSIQQSRTNLSRNGDYDNAQIAQSILFKNQKYVKEQEFNLNKTLELNVRSPLAKPDNPILKARVPQIFGFQENSRNPLSDNHFSLRAKSLNYNTINKFDDNPILNQTFDQTNQDLNDRDSLLYKGQESQQMMINMKQRDLSTLKKQKFNNSLIYENNISNIGRVKTHWNKKILDPKIDKYYLHSVVKKQSENELEETIVEAISKYEVQNDDMHKSLLKNKMNNSGEQQSQSRLGKQIKHQAKHLQDDGRGSKLSQVLRLPNELQVLKSKLPVQTVNNNETITTQGKNSFRSSVYKPKLTDSLSKKKNKLLQEEHQIVFVEDGQPIQTCKSLKLNINFFKSRYFIDPPKYISQLPPEFLKVQRKFNKRAYKEILETCSKELTNKTIVFDVMYTIEGELIESMDEIDDDCGIVIVSPDRFKFIGITNNREGLQAKDLRVENSKIVRSKLQAQNKEWANQKYLEWIERICDKLNVENMQLSLSKYANNDYLSNNEDYRSNFLKKLGQQNNGSPTYQGGGLRNCNEFLLPQIQHGPVRDQIRRLRSNNFEKQKDYKDSVSSARWGDDFVKALDKFRHVNQYKEKSHLGIAKPSIGSIITEQTADPKYSYLSNQSSPLKLDQDMIKNLQKLNTQAIQKEAKIKAHAKTINAGNQKSSRKEKNAVFVSNKKGDSKLHIGAQTHQQKTLSYEECKKLSDEYLLPCKVVYELHSEFNSLFVMGQDYAKRKNADLLGLSPDKLEEEDNNQDDGVLLEVFKDASSIIKEKHPDVQERILLALNISVMAKHAKINWPTFLMFNCILKYFTAVQAQYVTFWLNFLNPNHLRFITKAEFLDIMEKVVRGSYTDTETLVSVKFSEMIYSIFRDKNVCKEDNEDIIIEKLERKLLKNEIEIEFLNQTLKPIMQDIL